MSVPIFTTVVDFADLARIETARRTWCAITSDFGTNGAGTEVIAPSGTVTAKTAGTDSTSRLGAANEVSGPEMTTDDTNLNLPTDQKPSTWNVGFKMNPVKSSRQPGLFRHRYRPALDFSAIAREATLTLPAVLVRVLPGGQVVGREYVALNPRRTDHHPGSFKVRFSGARAGAWADFATGDRGGDIISLVAYLEGIRQHEAARLLAQMLGVDLGEARHG
jgi:hypothetical protein